MFFIISYYINKNFGYVFNKMDWKADIEQGLEEECCYINITIPDYYSTQEQLDALV